MAQKRKTFFNKHVLEFNYATINGLVHPSCCTLFSILECPWLGSVFYFTSLDQNKDIDEELGRLCISRQTCLKTSFFLLSAGEWNNQNCVFRLG
jgi:hypothetical protein